MSPLAFMRGRTFSESFIFADEMQNSTPEQMLMLLTRIGNNSKIVISGDLAQTDIGGGRSGPNGLQDFVYKYKKSKYSGGGGGSWPKECCDDEGNCIGFDRKGVDCYYSNSEMIRIIEFDKKDVRRSKLTSVILDLYAADQ
jgi:phosphate starvation-inducible protein PhoH